MVGGWKMVGGWVAERVPTERFPKDDGNARNGNGWDEWDGDDWDEWDMVG